MSRRSRVVHRSIDYHRVEWDRENRPNSLEQTLAEEWEKENDRDRHNGGVLQALMRSYTRDERNQLDLVGFDRLVVTPRDAMMAATAVQWLGTNVGRCTLEAACKRAGYQLRYPFDIEAERRQREREIARERAEILLDRTGWRWIDL